jgi:23S rRNA (pseudouridine1915-N3)-methyltransferase
MKLHVAWLQARPGKDKSSATAQLTAEYLKRIGKYAPVESSELGSVAALEKLLPRTHFVALDSRGKQLTSEQLANFIAEHQTRGTQRLLFAVGPADGWSKEVLERAHTKLSLGPMTLPHELARVVLLEQLYRAFTIIHKHPYHCGH